MFKNNVFSVKVGIGLFVLLLCNIFVPDIALATADIEDGSLHVTTAGGIAGCYTAGQDITVNFRVKDNPDNNIMAAVVFSTNNTTLEYNDDAVWTSGGPQNPPDTDGFDGGAVAKSATYVSVSLTVRVPSSYTTSVRVFVVARRDGYQLYSWGGSGYDDIISIDMSPCASSPITAAKSAAPMSVCVGSNVTFCITATNTGGLADTFDIWDTVPTGLTYVGCDNSCSWDGLNKVVSWTITSLAAHAEVTTCFWASVNAVP